MAVKIRLLRVGKKKQPYYRVVVADSRSPRDGHIIERIGRYSPLDDPSTIEIDADKALGWLSKGAQPSEAVQKLLETSGVWGQFTSARPNAGTAARKKIESHKLALANRPEPEPVVEPEPAVVAEEPAAEVAEEPVAEVAEEPAAEVAEEPAAQEEEAVAEEPAAQEEEAAAEEPAAEPEPEESKSEETPE